MRPSFKISHTQIFRIFTAVKFREQDPQPFLMKNYLKLNIVVVD